MANQGQARVVAIQAMDVVDYERLIQADRVGTLARINTYRRVLIDPLLAASGGRLVGTLGHSWIAEFPDAMRAVRCAMQVQADIAKRNQNAPALKRIAFRVGVAVGGMRVEGDDIGGDGVRAAADMLATAKPGDVRLSGPAMADARKDRGLGLDRLAEAGPTEADGGFRISIRQPSSDKPARAPTAPKPGSPRRAASKGRSTPTPARRRPAWAIQEKRAAAARPAPPPDKVGNGGAAPSDESAGGVSMISERRPPPKYGQWALGLAAGLVVIVIGIGIIQFGGGLSSSDVLSDSLTAAQRANAEAARAARQASAGRTVIVVEEVVGGDGEARLLEQDERGALDADNPSIDDVLSALALLSEEEGEATALTESLRDVPEQDLSRALDIYVSILEDTGRADEAARVVRRVQALRQRANAGEPSP